MERLLSRKCRPFCSRPLHATAIPSHSKPYSTPATMPIQPSCRQAVVTQSMRSPGSVKKSRLQRKQNGRKTREECDSMTDLSTKKTGLPMSAYVFAWNYDHGPRMKVSRRYGDTWQLGNQFSMTIDDDPKIIGNTGNISARDINKVVDFIALNKKVLLEYWKQDTNMDSYDLLCQIQRV